MALLPLLYHDWKDLMRQCQNCSRHQRLNYQRQSSSDETSCCFNMLRQNNDMDRHKDRLDLTLGHGATQHRQRCNTPVLQHDRKDHCQGCGLDLALNQMSSDKNTCNLLQQNNDMDRHKDRLDITLGHGASQHRQRYNTPVHQHVCKDLCQSCSDLLLDLRQKRLSSSDETTGYLNSQQNHNMDRHKDRLDPSSSGATHHRQRYNAPVPQHVCKDDQIVLDVQHFEPEEIQVKIVNNYIVVTAKHEDKGDEHGWVSRQFVRRFQLPENFKIEQLTSKLFNGRLTIVAPKIQPLKDELDKLINFPINFSFIDDLYINKKQENPKNIQQSEEKEKPE